MNVFYNIYLLKNERNFESRSATAVNSCFPSQKVEDIVTRRSFDFPLEYGET